MRSHPVEPGNSTVADPLRLEGRLAVTTPPQPARGPGKTAKRGGRGFQFPWTLKPGQVRQPRRYEAFAVEPRSEAHTSELVTNAHFVCRLLLEKNKTVR